MDIFYNLILNKWVLPKNINISSSLLSTYSGTIELSGNTITTIDYNSYVESICSKMNIPTRIDLLNIQVGNDLEVSTILSLTNSSYRPGLIIVNYTNRPDTNIFTTQCAAHLQNIGYKLIQKEDNKFLYLYNDKNVYEFTWLLSELCELFCFFARFCQRNMAWTMPGYPVKPAN